MPRKRPSREQTVLWAPWRMGYILGSRRGGCFLCRALRDRSPDSFVVRRGRRAFVTLNIYPYSNGHLLVVPNRHVADLEALTPAEEREMTALLRRSLVALKKLLRPHGFNVGLNLGRAAGAGIATHLHVHVVPRWDGDTNFMPALAGAKVMPQSLEELRGALAGAFRRPAA